MTISSRLFIVATSSVSPPRLETKPVEPWTPDEARPFLRVIKGERLGPLYEVAIGTGFRQGELLGFTWPNVALDVEIPTIAVTQTLQRFGSELRLVETKTTDSGRKPETRLRPASERFCFLQRGRHPTH